MDKITYKSLFSKEMTLYLLNESVTQSEKMGRRKRRKTSKNALSYGLTGYERRQKMVSADVKSSA